MKLASRSSHILAALFLLAALCSVDLVPLLRGGGGDHFYWSPAHYVVALLLYALGTGLLYYWARADEARECTARARSVACQSTRNARELSHLLFFSTLLLLAPATYLALQPHHHHQQHFSQANFLTLLNVTAAIAALWYLHTSIAFP